MDTGLSFPSQTIQALVCLVYFIGLSAISHCVSHRFPTGNWRHIPWIRWLNFCVFVDSWLFTFTSGLLIFGIGLETSLNVCRSGIFLCIIFYASTKALLYIFLIEKVHIVWSISANQSRLRSPVYLLGLMSILLYCVVTVLLVVGRITYISERDRYCYIGLKFYASVALLTYDLYITVFLTALFLWPLMSSKMIINSPLRQVARKTLVSASVALAMSTVNIAILTAWHGHERGYVCLVCCTTDIICNSLALFWVTKDAQVNSRYSSTQHENLEGGVSGKNVHLNVSGQATNGHRLSVAEILNTNANPRNSTIILTTGNSGFDKAEGNKSSNGSDRSNGSGSSDSVRNLKDGSHDYDSESGHGVEEEELELEELPVTMASRTVRSIGDSMGTGMVHDGMPLQIMVTTVKEMV
ncbi:hypothetical protein D9758_008385 [Tetrapyrgos nigripes]|uniref:Transmembrane protein n=1 Tax=Tetrapyrgos nigripes TaxID=182062 RepID=A0A8H5GEA3_9AGAR|nr:hypothetical protein D9758_008385 [Tetrapyrgos nigripes]